MKFSQREREYKDMNVLLRSQPPPESKEKNQSPPNSFLFLNKCGRDRASGHILHAAGAASADGKDIGGFFACLFSVMMRHANSCGTIREILIFCS